MFFGHIRVNAYLKFPDFSQVKFCLFGYKCAYDQRSLAWIGALRAAQSVQNCKSA